MPLFLYTNRTPLNATINIAVTDVNNWSDIIKSMLNNSDNNVARFIIDEQSVNGSCGYISIYPDKLEEARAKLIKLGKKYGNKLYNMLDTFVLAKCK